MLVETEEAVGVHKSGFIELPPVRSILTSSAMGLLLEYEPADSAISVDLGEVRGALARIRASLRPFVSTPRRRFVALKMVSRAEIYRRRTAREAPRID